MKKKLLKKIRKEISDIKNEQKRNSVETENLERVFPIEVIASTFENRLLIDYKQIEDFWCFITNENVNLSNIERFIKIIREEVLKQYPDLKVRNYYGDWCLTEKETEYLKKWYKENNGHKISIKSIKKGYTKTLKIQD